MIVVIQSEELKELRPSVAYYIERDAPLEISSRRITATLTDLLLAFYLGVNPEGVSKEIFLDDHIHAELEQLVNSIEVTFEISPELVIDVMAFGHNGLIIFACEEEQS